MEPFKNEFSYQNCRRLAEALHRVYPGFSVTRFSRGLERALPPLAMKQRMRLLADRLEAGLPTNPPELFAILVQALASDDQESDGMRGFLVWPLTEIVARRGMNHLDAALAALREMTMRFTAEFAIRPFLIHHRQHTLQQLATWCDHPNEHVRRLVSEGSRPLLPWGGKLAELLEPPLPTLRLLEKLRADPSAYVRLSVANHLNDLSKTQPELVLATLNRWREQTPDDARLERLTRHACRTLIKNGHLAALAFHGFRQTTALQLEVCELAAPGVALGGQLEYRLLIHNTSRRVLRVLFDYAILHRKANGSLVPKVFKGRTRDLTPGERWEICGRHAFQPVTTRVYHPGRHGFEPRLNGRPFPPRFFQLEI